MADAKVIVNGEVFIDLTADTATESDVAQGKTFHKSNGEIATGTASGGSTPDCCALVKDLSFASAVSSGSQTLVTAAELVSAGILSSTSESIFNKWSHYEIELISTSSSPTTKHLVGSYLSSQGVYNNGSWYYRMIRYHNTSATSLSNTQNNGSITASANGCLFYTAGTGIRLTASSTYRLYGAYKLRIFVIGRK